ncbi:MAG TPA: DUF559 domain-containing protein [bacterium]|nr:DUF559 domain-containing protein [bacterium]
MKKLRTYARDLRKNLTPAERKLWRYLRASRFEKAKFRRQEPIGPFIVDFVCYEQRLIIECDGGHHDLQTLEDGARDHWLEEQGFKVLRFWNNEIFNNFEGVMKRVWDVVQPSPARGRAS